MENKEIYFKTKDVRMGELRDLHIEEKGFDIEKYGKVFMVKDREGEYYNPFNVFDTYSVYERLPYSNFTEDGESFGSKIRHLQGTICNGPCIVLESEPLTKYIKTEEVSYCELENTILDSACFYKDFEDIILSKNYNFIKEKRILKRFEKDIEKLDKFLGEKEKIHQLKK